MKRALIFSLYVCVAHFLSAQALTADICPAYEVHHMYPHSSTTLGSIDLHVNAGVPPYEYSWVWEGVGIISIDEDISNLFPSSPYWPSQYCVTVTDALCGQAVECFLYPIKSYIIQ